MPYSSMDIKNGVGSIRGPVSKKEKLDFISELNSTLNDLKRRMEDKKLELESLKELIQSMESYQNTMTNTQTELILEVAKMIGEQPVAPTGENK